MAPARDPGLQPERTALAWKRTSLGMVANALLMLRSAFMHASPPVVVLALLLLCGSAWLLARSTVRGRDLRTGRQGASAHLVARAAALVAVAGVVACAGMLARGLSA